jgi:hypothetical protein
MSGPLDVHDLLVLARETLQNDLAEAIAPSGRFTAALIANALAIAARETLEHPDADRAVAAARAAIRQRRARRALASARSGVRLRDGAGPAAPRSHQPVAFAALRNGPSTINRLWARVPPG